MHKFAKLLLCGIYSIFKDSKIPFLFSFYSTNFSFIQKIDKSRRNFVFFSEKKFLKIFPKIKTLKDRDIKLKNNFEKKISYLQFKSNKQSSSKYRIFGAGILCVNTFSVQIISKYRSLHASISCVDTFSVWRISKYRILDPSILCVDTFSVWKISNCRFFDPSISGQGILWNSGFSKV